MKRNLRAAALILLPASLLAALTYVAAALTLLLVLCTSQRRRVRLALPVIGVLVAGLLASIQAFSSDTLGARSAPLLAGPLGTWSLWLIAAVALVVIYASLSPDDAPLISVGSSVAALTGGGLALYQVAATGDTQAVLLTFHPNLAAAGFIAAIGGILVGFGRAWRHGSLARLQVSGGLAAGLLGLLFTGSRSGLIGATAGALVLTVLAVARVRWRPLLIAVLALSFAGAALYLVDRSLRGPDTPNVLTNSGFEERLLPWVLNGATQRGPFDQSTQDSEYSVKLQRAEPSTIRFVRYAGGLEIPEDEHGQPVALAFSLSAKPVAAVAEDEAEGLPVVLLFEALDADGNLVSRLGVDGWTEEASASLDMVGGRPRLPVEPLDEWQRFTLTVPPVPAAASTFRLELQPGSGALGTYGLIDDVMLAPASVATTYVPGPRPGLFTFLTPATSRLQQLRRPFEAAGGRVSMWLLGLELAAARPVLGYGPGSERAIANEYAAERVRRPLLHFHSFYLRLLLEGGSVLLAAVLVMVGYLLVAGVRGAFKRTPGALALVATTVALLVQSMFDPVLAFGEVVGGLWLVIAVSGASDQPSEDQERPAEAANPS